MVENPYEVLGVSPDASPDEVKKAYRKKARENHPDLNPDDPNASERMNQINEAYDRIMNPEKYAKSDRRAGASASAQGGGAQGAGGAQQPGAGRPYGQPGGGSQGGYGYGYGQPGQSGQGGWTFVDWDDIFGFGGAGYGYAGNEPIHPEVSAEDSPEIRSVIDAINAGRFQEAIHTLNMITSDGRNARWYYLSALANDGAGNTVMAQEQIRRAVRMDPNNRDYQRAQQKFSQTGQSYQQQTQDRGFNTSGFEAAAICAGIWCCAPLLCNCCAGAPVMMM